MITLCLSGCGKDKITATSEFLPDEVLAVQVDVNSWNIDSLSATDFQLKNNSGYVTVSNLTADSLDILSTAGDITVKNGNIVNLVIATTSGYVSLKDTTFDDTDIITKSGEVNISQISPNTNTSLQTAPENLSFAIASGSKDITAY